MSDRVTVEDGRIYLMGFSQGGQMAAEITARHAERFGGAVIMSPGGRRNFDPIATPSPLAAQRRFVVLVNAEHPGNVALAKADRSKLEALGAKVQFQASTVTAHSLPPNFLQRLPAWLAFLQGTGKQK